MDWRTVLPGLALLARYERGWLRADLVAGLTVGAMLVPQCMAYAELAGLPPQFGFLAALLPPITYALFGSSRHLGVGPEPGTAVLAATGIAALSAGDPARYASLMPVLAAMVGLFAMLAAVLRLGFLAQLLSKPVLVGYITGVGLTLLSSQLGKFTGVSIASGEFFPRVWEFSRELSHVRPLTLAVSLGSLVALIALKKKAPRAPAALLVVTSATLIVWALRLDLHGVRLVGAISGTLPRPHLPLAPWRDVVKLVPTALGIALVGYTDNVLTARSIAAKLGYRIDANRELVALSAINLSSAFAGGFPVSSGASRTAVPAALGSKTQLVGVIASLFVLATLLLLAPALAHIPQPCLAAVIVAAAFAIIDVDGYRSLWKVSKTEFFLAIAAALGVMVFDMLTGVLVAVGLSVLVTFARITVPHDAVLVRAEALDGWVDPDLVREGSRLEGLLVYRFDAPLFFANSERFRERLELMLETNQGDEEWVVLDFEGVGDVDATALEMLSELVAQLRERGAVVAVARANDRALAALQRSSLLGEGGMTSFATINSAVRAFAHRSGAGA
ncbi:MAG: sulfate permease [Myxococcales bacterium]|nr:sulfate permease [Myxococcales bacterium]